MIELERHGIIAGYENHPLTREEQELARLLASISLEEGQSIGVRIFFAPQDTITSDECSSNRYDCCFDASRFDLTESVGALQFVVKLEHELQLEELINVTVGAQLPGTLYWLPSFSTHDQAAWMAELEERP